MTDSGSGDNSEPESVIRDYIYLSSHSQQGITWTNTFKKKEKKKKKKKIHIIDKFGFYFSI